MTNIGKVKGWSNMRARNLLLVIMAVFCLSVSIAGQELMTPPAGAASPLTSESLTLDRAISLALENNRSAKIARLETEKASDRVAEQKTYRLPQFKLTTLVQQPLTSFDTTFEKGLFGTVPAEDTVVTSSMKPNALVIAQMSQPLTQLHRINLQIKQQQAAAEITKAQLSATEQQLVNDVKRAYYAILETQGAFESAEATIKLYQEIDRITGEYVVQQVALKTDHMDVQTQLAKAEYQVLTLNNQLASQKEQLNNLLGRDVRTSFVVTDAMESAQIMMRETDLAHATQKALSQRPELREASLKLEQAKLDKRIKKSEFIPDVSLTVNYVSTFSYSDFLPRSVSGIGVQMEWEFFDWGRKKRQLAEKEVSIKQADNQLQESQNQIVMEVNSRFRRMQEACQLLRVTKQAQTAARATVQMVTYRYRQDAVLLKDVLKAQASLADSNYEYQKALLSFWTAKADFEKAIGEDK
jgi:outer membrane protein TolC